MTPPHPLFLWPHLFLPFLTTLSLPCSLVTLFSPTLPCFFFPSSDPRRSWGKLLWGWFCGLSGAPEQARSPAETAAQEQKLTSTEEEPLWRSVCNVNAILLLAINVFLWGYFA